MAKILLVEDDQSLGPALSENLSKEGFQVTLKTSLKETREANFAEIDLVLLDWMLPDGQGIDLLRDVPKGLPVILLTARTDLVDKVLGLESGAIDYVTKPFEPRELIARIRAHMRSQQNKQEFIEEKIAQGELELNRSERKAYLKGTEVILTKMEFDLLFLLMSSPKQIFSREKLLDKVWGYENYPTTRTVDTHVLQIRQKIGNDVIETIRGIGYRFGVI